MNSSMAYDLRNGKKNEAEKSPPLEKSNQFAGQISLVCPGIAIGMTVGAAFQSGVAGTMLS